MKHPKLTDAEAARLKKYLAAHGGQEPVAVAWRVSSTTLSRTLNRNTAPSPLLRKKLEEIGIIKKSPLPIL